MSDTKNSKLLALFDTLPWYKKLRVLQIIADWDQSKAAENYCTTQKQVWAWNQGINIPQRKSRQAIASAHGLQVTDIFPVDMLKPDEVRKGA
jgi:hypothetical protein